MSSTFTIMWRSVSTLLIAAMLSASCNGVAPGSRVSRIRQRGFLVCGVFPGIAGFAQVDGQGHYTGFDVDFCRAVAAAIVGSAERIRYQPVASIEVGARPWGIAVSADGRTLYTANGPSNDVSIVDVAARAVTTRVRVGDSPWGVALVP